MGTEIHLRGLHQCPGRVRGTISCIGHIVSNTWLYHLIISNRTWCKHHPWYVIHVLAGSATPTCGMVQDGMGETPGMIYPWEWHHHSVINEKCVNFILPSQMITCLSTLEVKLRHWNTQLCPELIWSLQIWAHVNTWYDLALRVASSFCNKWKMCFILFYLVRRSHVLAH